MTYPCTTTHGGTSPGRPCIFPINLTTQNKTTMYPACFNGAVMEIPESACFTKAYNNNSINVKEERDYFWGYCPKSCTGQTVSPLSPFNLARRSNTKLWISEFYDFSVWENNFCHTYDPPEKSNPDFLNRIIFMIAKNPNYIDQNYKIFIHERGQFWPRYDMMSFGQPDPLMLSPNKELEIFFSINQITRFSKRGRECVEETDYSFTQCLHNYARSASKCHIGAIEKKCTKESFIKYFQILIHLKRKNIANRNTLGSYHCRRRRYHGFSLRGTSGHPLRRGKEPRYETPGRSFVVGSTPYP